MVIDTMVFAYALLNVEDRFEQALAVLENVDQIVVPDSLFIELGNVIWQWIQFRQLPLHFSPLALKTLLLSLLPVSGSIHLALTTKNLAPLILYPVMSLVTFALYADDKSRARQGKRRIPEKTLHLSELIGGWLGGFVAQQILRHKSSKESYQSVFWAIAILHIGFWLQLLWRTKM